MPASQNQKSQLNPILRGTVPSTQWQQTYIDRSDCHRLVPMKVLCLGWPRTGSKSTSAALYILGLDDVYHFSCAIENPPDCNMWLRAINAKWNGKGTFTKDDWDALLGHCQAVTDFPAAAFADELIAAYPDAKVLLNIRPTDKWYESVATTVFRSVDSMSWRFRVCEWLIGYFGPNGKYLYPMKNALRLGVTNNNLSKAALREAYENHNAHVQAIVPPENLLLWGPQDGWEPLCKFLDVSLPGVPLPFVNETKAWTNNANDILRKDLRFIARRIVLGLGLSIGMAMVAYKSTHWWRGYWSSLSQMFW